MLLSCVIKLWIKIFISFESEICLCDLFKVMPLRRTLERRLELCVSFQDWVIPILAAGVGTILKPWDKFVSFFICFLIFLQFSSWHSGRLALLSTTLTLNTQTSVEIALIGCHCTSWMTSVFHGLVLFVCHLNRLKLNCFKFYLLNCHVLPHKNDINAV